MTGWSTFSGSLLLVVVLHVCQDLLALLVVPAQPSAPRSGDDAALARSAESDRRIT
ncbi:hypothetical protein [Actinoplanes sp. NPDC026623]|uniref:hypothetical protein n=1 Tax=Actinoplanes sp. NPDC026623 TaxID=3155610 RepID=UPI0033C92B3D